MTSAEERLRMAQGSDAIAEDFRKYPREQLIDALVNEWEYLCLEDPEEGDTTGAEYRKDLEQYTYEQLMDECSESVDLLDNDDEEDSVTFKDWIESWTNTKAYEKPNQ